jgi:hypothetical protein
VKQVLQISAPPLMPIGPQPRNPCGGPSPKRIRSFSTRHCGLRNFAPNQSTAANGDEDRNCRICHYTIGQMQRFDGKPHSMAVPDPDAPTAGDIAECRLIAAFSVMLSGYGCYLVHGSDTMRPIAQTFSNWLLAEAGEGPDNEKPMK